MLQIDDGNIHAIHNRGISYERTGRYREAIEDFTAVTILDRENANAYFNRGCCYDSVGELDLAISDYSMARELDMKTSGKKGSALGSDKNVTDRLVGKGS